MLGAWAEPPMLCIGVISVGVLGVGVGVRLFSCGPQARPSHSCYTLACWRGGNSMLGAWAEPLVHFRMNHMQAAYPDRVFKGDKLGVDEACAI